MPLEKTSRFPPPASWEEFEQICRDLFARIWGDPKAQRHGRKGQPQHGVDVFGQPASGPDYAGVQVKLKDQGFLTPDELRAEVEKARSFEPPIIQFTLATTSPTDSKVQEEARRLTAKHASEGMFTVEVLSWDEMQSRLADYPDLIRTYWPQFYTVAQEEAPASAIVELLKTHAQIEEDDKRPTFERTDASMRTMAQNFEPSWKIKQVTPGAYASDLEWRFCGPRFEMEWRQASGSALDRTRITERFDLTSAPIRSHERVGGDEIGLEIRFHWRGKWRHELHRWHLSFRDLPNGQHCDVLDEILPPIRFDE